MEKNGNIYTYAKIDKSDECISEANDSCEQIKMDISFNVAGFSKEFHQAHVKAFHISTSIECESGKYMPWEETTHEVLTKCHECTEKEQRVFQHAKIHRFRVENGAYQVTLSSWKSWKRCDFGYRYHQSTIAYDSVKAVPEKELFVPMAIVLIMQVCMEGTVAAARNGCHEKCHSPNIRYPFVRLQLWPSRPHNSGSVWCAFRSTTHDVCVCLHCILGDPRHLLRCHRATGSWSREHSHLVEKNIFPSRVIISVEEGILFLYW